MCCLNRTTRRQCAIKRFDIQCCTGRQYTGAHRDDRLSAALEQLDGHAAENILLSDCGALAGIENHNLHATIAQHLRQRNRVYRVPLAIIIFKEKPPSLLAVAVLTPREPIKYSVTIKMQDMNGSLFLA